MLINTLSEKIRSKLGLGKETKQKLKLGPFRVKTAMVDLWLLKLHEALQLASISLHGLEVEDVS